MKSIKEIRRERLHRLVDGYPSQRQFAEAVGLSPAQLNQLMGGYRDMGDSVARRIEVALGLSVGFMDHLDEPMAQDNQLLSRLLPADQLKLLHDYLKLSPLHQSMIRETAAAYVSLEQVQR